MAIELLPLQNKHLQPLEKQKESKLGKNGIFTYSEFKIGGWHVMNRLVVSKLPTSWFIKKQFPNFHDFFIQSNFCWLFVKTNLTQFDWIKTQDW